jgi:membrane protein YqaA with SNARE-associated domain
LAPANRTYVLAGAWGLAEATLFFIVPDVHLSWVALKNYRSAMMACVCATAAALVGGAVIWSLGAKDPEPVRAVFDWMPAIGPAMIAEVADQLGSHGISALFIGPLTGTPYKIYALEAAGAGFGLIVFLLISIPARMIRFVVVASIAAVSSHYLQRILSMRVLYGLHITLWTAFYIFYFSVMPS